MRSVDVYYYVWGCRYDMVQSTTLMSGSLRDVIALN